MPDSLSTPGSGQFKLLDELAEEFAAQNRRGERPSLTEYTNRYPELADAIRDLFPAMVEIHCVEDEWSNLTGTGPARGCPAATAARGRLPDRPGDWTRRDGDRLRSRAVVAGPANR